MFDHHDHDRLYQGWRDQPAAGTRQGHGRNLVLVPFSEPGLPRKTPQQLRVERLLADFDRDVNAAKTLGKGYWSGHLLEELNLRLFGFLGDANAIAAAGAAEFPHNRFLSASKGCFWNDLAAMVDVVKTWRIGGGRVVINDELCFAIGGESSRFFHTLQFMGELKDHNAGYYRDWAQRTFGVVPGESHGRNYGAWWQPEATAVMIRGSLEAENTVNQVAKALVGIKSRHGIKLEAGSMDDQPGGLPAVNRRTLDGLRARTGAWADTLFDSPPPRLRREAASPAKPATAAACPASAIPGDGFLMVGDRYGDFASIERLDLASLKRLRYTDWTLVQSPDGNAPAAGRPDLATFRALELQLEVDEVVRAQDYAHAIPAAVLDKLESFLADAAAALESVPFRLTPELYILSGPVAVRTTVIQVLTDPLIILRFAEFPNLLIPVAYWLPVSQNHAWQTGEPVVQVRSRMG